MTTRIIDNIVYENGVAVDVAAPIGGKPTRLGVVTTKIHPVTGGVGKIVNVSTFSETESINEKSLIFVQEDETNGGQMTAYFHNGQNLNWLPSVEV